MKHHFGDFLDRDGDYWTIIPNRERYVYSIGDVEPKSPDVTIVTIGADDENWERIFTLPNLEELTLHEPTNAQLESIAKLRGVRRLRITHARPKNVSFLSEMIGVEELVMEYVSGFSDLTPLQKMPKLRSLHLENLRRVSNFDGLSGIASLRFLSIYGTLDWKQPIDNFTFLRGLRDLEVLSMFQVFTKAPFPALLPAAHLRNLKKLKLHRSYLDVQEYALLEVALPEAEGTAWGPYTTEADSTSEVPADDFRSSLPEVIIRAKHPEIRFRFDGKRLIDDPNSLWFVFTGKGVRRVKCGISTSESRCNEYSIRYEEMKAIARELVAKAREEL